MEAKTVIPDFKEFLENLFENLESKNEILIDNIHLNVEEHDEYVNWVLEVLERNHFINLDEGHVKKGPKMHGIQDKKELISRAYDVLVNA